MLFSIPEADTAEKYGHAAKKNVKHHAATSDRCRLNRLPMRTSVSASPMSVVDRDHTTGSASIFKPSAFHTTQSGDVKPMTHSPGLKTSPLPAAKFRA